MFKSFLIFLFLIQCHLVDTQIKAIDEINIGQTTLKYFDEKRDRPMIIEMWYPTIDSLKVSDKNYSPFLKEFTVRDAKFPLKKYPLILISHGNGGNRLSLEWLSHILVKNGYVVAAVDHWGNTFDNAIAIEFVKPWERPIDISFSLNMLLDYPEINSIIDNNKIGVIGFSYGGYTALALAGAELDYELLLQFYNTPEGKLEINSIPEFPNLWKELQNPKLIKMMQNIPNVQDKRIKAVFAISPGTARGFNERRQFKNVEIPVFITGSAADNITPVISYARKYHNLIPHSEYYEFGGMVGHYVMLAEASDHIKKQNPIPFKDHPSVDRHEVHIKVSELVVSFFNKKLDLFK